MMDVQDAGQLRIGTPRRQEPLPPPAVAVAPGEPAPLRSGWHYVRFDNSWKESPGEVVMVADGPLPCTIRSVAPVIETEG
jgi:hypothetical protein